jgi:DNA methylase
LQLVAVLVRYLRTQAATVRQTNQALAAPVAFTAFAPASPAVLGEPAPILKRTLGRTFEAEACAYDGHGHGTQKPVECMRRPIENNSSPGQAVYEPFSGSGTTIVAAAMTGRSCFAIEIDPAYVDVAVLRWQAFTGEDARLDKDGRSFAEVAAERRGESAG